VGQSRCRADRFLRCSAHGTPEMMSQHGCESDDVDANLSEIDDKEFDIPPIDHQPTLESILSLPDDEQSLIDSDISFASEFPRPGHAPFIHPVCFLDAGRRNYHTICRDSRKSRQKKW